MMEVTHTAILATESDLVPERHPTTVWADLQHGLFPWLAEELGPLSEQHKHLVQLLEFVRVEELLPGTRDSGRVARRRAGPPWRGLFWPRRCSLCPPPGRWSSGCATTRPCAACPAWKPSAQSQLGDLLAGLRWLRDKRVSRALARVLVQADTAGPLGGARLSRLDGDPSARATGA